MSTNSGGSRPQPEGSGRSGGSGNGGGRRSARFNAAELKIGSGLLAYLERVRSECASAHAELGEAAGIVAASMKTSSHIPLGMRTIIASRIKRAMEHAAELELEVGRAIGSAAAIARGIEAKRDEKGGYDPTR